MLIERKQSICFSENKPTDVLFDVTSKDDLVKIPWISKHVNNPDNLGIFYGKKSNHSLDYLMVLNKKTFNQTIIGYIHGNGEKLGLENYLNHTKLA